MDSGLTQNILKQINCFLPQKRNISNVVAVLISGYIFSIAAVYPVLREQKRSDG